MAEYRTSAVTLSVSSPARPAGSGGLRAPRGDLLAGQQPNGRVLPQAAPGVPRVSAALLASETPGVRLLLRRLRGRCAHLGHAPAPGTAEPRARPRSRPSLLT